MKFMSPDARNLSHKVYKYETRMGPVIEEDSLDPNLVSNDHLLVSRKT